MLVSCGCGIGHCLLKTLRLLDSSLDYQRLAWPGWFNYEKIASAVAWAIDEASRRPASDHILVNLSGRGDKDTQTVAKERGVDLS